MHRIHLEDKDTPLVCVYQTVHKSIFVKYTNLFKVKQLTYIQSGAEKKCHPKGC